MLRVYYKIRNLPCPMQNADCVPTRRMAGPVSFQREKDTDTEL